MRSVTMGAVRGMVVRRVFGMDPGMPLGWANVRGQHLAAAVVAALDDTPTDVLQRDLRFVVVDGGAPGHVVDVDVVHARQSSDLALHAGGAEAGD